MNNRNSKAVVNQASRKQKVLIFPIDKPTLPCYRCGFEFGMIGKTMCH